MIRMILFSALMAALTVQPIHAQAAGAGAEYNKDGGLERKRAGLRAEYIRLGEIAEQSGGLKSPFIDPLGIGAGAVMRTATKGIAFAAAKAGSTIVFQTSKASAADSAKKLQEQGKALYQEYKDSRSAAHNYNVAAAKSASLAPPPPGPSVKRNSGGDGGGLDFSALGIIVEELVKATPAYPSRGTSSGGTSSGSHEYCGRNCAF